MRQFNALRVSIDKYDSEIEALLEDHKDGAIFKSLPGAGANMASRLLVAFGTDRGRFPSASAIQRFSGIAPALKHRPVAPAATTSAQRNRRARPPRAG